VALMAQEGSGPVKTFSIGFEEAGYDELPYARMVAEMYSTDHHEFIVRPDGIGMLSKIVWHYNEPFADSSAIPTYYLAELTRQHVTVALNGDGGDESFAGYPRYLANVAAARYQGVPGFIRTPLNAIIARLPSADPRSTIGRIKRFADAMPETPERRYAHWLMHFQPGLKGELCTSDFIRQSGGDATQMILDEYAASDARNFVDATLDVDVNRYLPDDLLVKVDIATMAHGLEARSPFLDHPFMEFAASLPHGLKLRGHVTKHILKKAVRGLLPDEVIDRPKMGFGVPIEHWFRGELKECAFDLLLSRASSVRGYFHTAVVRRLIDEHMAGVRAWHYQLWNLVILELWHRTFIDQRPSVPSATLTGRRGP
jgi:asparagine synthase (glutamine-hydrolysing)